jgi:RNA polymerase sigma-70 factor (ECF subfamily)
MELPDTYYVRQMQAGDAAGFACLLDRYSRPVHSLILKLVGNREDAEELAQDVFMKVYKHAGSFRGESSFSTWIYRIAYHTAISAVRKTKREFLAIDESLIAQAADERMDEISAAHADEWLDRLDEALAKLQADEQAIILFFYMQEKSVEEIAAITGLSLSNVKTRLHRIRKKLFVILNEWKEGEQA